MLRPIQDYYKVHQHKSRILVVLRVSWSITHKYKNRLIDTFIYLYDIYKNLVFMC